MSCVTTSVSLILQKQIHIHWEKHANSFEIECGRKNNKTSDVFRAVTFQKGPGRFKEECEPWYEDTSRWIQSKHLIPYEQRNFDNLVREKDLKMQVEADGCSTADFKIKGRSHELNHAQDFKNRQGKGNRSLPSPTHILCLNTGDLYKISNPHNSKTIHWLCVCFNK